MLKYLQFGSVSGKLRPFEDFSVIFFWFKTQFFQKSVTIAKKFFLQKLNIVQSMIYIFLGEIKDPKIYDRPSFSESAP
jgi:hypothetical protein